MKPVSILNTGRAAVGLSGVGSAGIVSHSIGRRKDDTHMNRSSLLGVIALVTAGLMCGCVTTPAPEGKAYPGYLVGDRTRVYLDEVVVSLPLKGATQPYQNLDVGLAAPVNPVKTTPYRPYSVRDILERLEARIAARVVECLSNVKELSLDNKPELRVRVAQEAQAVVDDAMRQWEFGADYEVKVLVVSFYRTEASVGRTPAADRQWWW